MNTRKSPLTKKSIKIIVECWLDQYESQRSRPLTVWSPAEDDEAQESWDCESDRLWRSSITRLRSIMPALHRWQSITHPTRSWAIGKAWNHLQTLTAGQFTTPGSALNFFYEMDDMVMDAIRRQQKCAQ